MTAYNDIVIIGLARWDSPYSSTTYSLAKELSKKQRVFYVDNPFTWKDFVALIRTDYIKSRWKALLFGVNTVYNPDPELPNLHVYTPPLVLPINFLKRGGLYNILSSRNQNRIKRAILRMLKRKRAGKFIYVNIFNPFAPHRLPKEKDCVLNIYYTVDDISEAIYIGKHGTYQEQDAMRVADLVLGTSRELEKKSRGFSDHVDYLPNAADFSLFQTVHTTTYDVPEELVGEKRKVIVYIGNIKDRDDFPLLKKIAEQHSDKRLLAIGPINTDDHVKLGIPDLPNVTFTGGKPLHQLPSYLQYGHCAIIPFRLSKLTKSIYPLKVNEYLASGLPVVSTNFSEDILTFADVVRISESHDEFINAITEAMESDTIEKKARRINTASQNTWEARAQQFRDIVASRMESFLSHHE